jgi:hypothetical protein
MADLMFFAEFNGCLGGFQRILDLSCDFPEFTWPKRTLNGLAAANLTESYQSPPNSHTSPHGFDKIIWIADCK